ncbi:Wzz/FepE/Etk N-terminal domain-containing protein [Leeuwenhoekiella sp. A16]|uniref:Wzz/FepE/Etk N-terminal domain-containing protein n=1 Tax=unclassified Leeuwenhoekiella TaxID=2615029 RepID=UPI003A7FB9BE
MDKENTSSLIEAKQDGIDLFFILHIFLSGRRIIGWSVTIGIILSILVILISKPEYKSSTIMIPQTTSSRGLGSNLSGLAAIAGINLSNSAPDNEVPITLYPKIVKSIPFERTIIKDSLSFKDFKEPLSFANYFIKKKDKSIINKVTSIFNDQDQKEIFIGGNNEGNIVVLSSEEEYLKGILRKRVLISIDEDSREITISCKMPEALPAAQLAQHVQKLLQEYVSDFRSQKAIEQLDFIKERYKEKEKSFNSIRDRLAAFRDRNRYLETSLAKRKLEELESEYDLEYSVFSDLAKQLEAQSIKVKEDTPVFTIIEPVSVPLKKDSPNKGSILILGIVLGIFTGCIIVFFLYFKNVYLRSFGNT